MARWAQLIADNDPDVWVQRAQEAHRPLDGEEVVEPATIEEQHLRLIDAEQLCSLGLSLRASRIWTIRAANSAFASSSSGFFHPEVSEDSLLAQGEDPEDILSDYPDLELDDIRACLAYAHAVIAHDSLDAVRVASK